MAVFVEYIVKPEDKGYNPNPLNVYVAGQGRLRFLPNETYQGRRVEAFTDEEAAQNVVKTYRNKLFAIAHDLIEAEKLDQIKGVIAEALAPLEARLAALEGKGNGAAPKRRVVRTKDAE